MQRKQPNNFFNSFPQQLASPLELGIKAAQVGNTTILKKLLDGGLNPNSSDKNGATLVFFAAKNSQTDIIELLVNYKANLNQPTKKGFTPIYIAATKNDAKMINILAKYGADLNAKTDSFTASFIAAQTHSMNALIALIKNGADINLTNKEGMSPVHIAAIQGYPDIIQLLVNSGANLNIKDHVDKMTPVSFAIQNENVDVIKTILLMAKDFKLQLSITDQKLIRNFIRELDDYTLKQLFIEYQQQSDKLHDVIIDVARKLNYIPKKLTASSHENNEDQFDHFNESDFDEFLFFDEYNEDSIDENKTPSSEYESDQVEANDANDNNSATSDDEDVGLCQGTTISWIEAALVKNNFLFNQHMQDILSLYRQSEADILKLQTSIEAKKGLDLKPEEQTLINVSAVYARTILYQQPYKYKAIFPTNPGQKQIEIISKVVSSLSIESAGYLCVASNILDILSFKEFANFFIEFENILNAMKYNNKFNQIACSLSVGGHTIGLVYDQENKNWLKLNVNTGLAIPINNTQELIYYHIQNDFEVCNLNKKSEFFYLQVIVPHHHPAVNQLKICLNNFKNDQLHLLGKKIGNNSIDNEKLIALCNIAAEDNLPEVFEILAQFKINLDQADACGYTPALQAAQFGNIDVLKILLNNQINHKQTDKDNCTAIFLAAQNGHIEIIKILIDAGADIDQPDIDNCTPIWTAARNGHIDIVKLLAEQNADLNQSNKINNTSPLLIAAQYGHQDIVDLLTMFQDKTKDGEYKFKF